MRLLCVAPQFPLLALAASKADRTTTDAKAPRAALDVRLLVDRASPLYLPFDSASNALTEAIRTENYDFLKLLVQTPSVAFSQESIDEALEIAAAKGAFDSVACLLRASHLTLRSSTADAALLQAIEHRHFDVATLLLRTSHLVFHPHGLRKTDLIIASSATEET